MRSKKSRHKLVALNFLSNISLDGKHESKPNGVDCHSSAPCICSDGKNVKTFEDNPVYGQQTSDTYYETVETLVPVKVLREPEASSNSAAHTQIHTSYNSCVNTSKAETCSNYYIPNVACSDASYVNSNVKRLENVTDQLSADKALASTDSVSPLFGAVPKTYIRVKLSRESTGSHYSHGLEDVKLLGKVNPKLSQSTSCPMFSKR
ncbi:unnamed protein product [Heterobilharzia americana]|nr:unnamed protein product [Heterobilharzia americana]